MEFSVMGLLRSASIIFALMIPVGLAMIILFKIFLWIVWKE